MAIDINPSDDIVKEIEEIYRLGKYKGGEPRVMKIKLRTQVEVNNIMTRTWKLRGTERF